MPSSGPLIHFVVDKPEEDTVKVVGTPEYTVFLSKAPMYEDESKTLKLGELTIQKVLNNLDKDGKVTEETISIYTYSAVWAKELPGCNGISRFVIPNTPIKDGSTELPGVYYGALDGVTSSGDFRNYGGSAEKVKDETPIRHYTLKYVPLTPYNNLPEGGREFKLTAIPVRLTKIENLEGRSKEFIERYNLLINALKNDDPSTSDDDLLRSTNTDRRLRGLSAAQLYAMDQEANGW